MDGGASVYKEARLLIEEDEATCCEMCVQQNSEDHERISNAVISLFSDGRADPHRYLYTHIYTYTHAQHTHTHIHTHTHTHPVV